MGIEQNMKPFGSCHRVEGARARELWRDRWQGYRIGGRTRTWGDCARTSTCLSNVSPPDWTLRSGTNRCRWTCSSVCRRWGTCTPPSASASRPHRLLARLSSLAEGFGSVSISCSGPNPPFLSNPNPNPNPNPKLDDLLLSLSQGNLCSFFLCLSNCSSFFFFFSFFFFSHFCCKWS